MAQPTIDDDALDEFAAPGGSLDDFLAEESSTDETPSSTDVEPTDDPVVHALDEDRALTLYGAMLHAVTNAVYALGDKELTPEAEAFRTYLADLLTELRR